MYIHIDPVTGSTCIIIDFVIPDRGTLSFNETDCYSMTHIISDSVILHNSITSGISVVCYTTAISGDRAVPKRETLAVIDVDPITTVTSDRDILDVHV